jgi:hypothetical protein
VGPSFLFYRMRCLSEQRHLITEELCNWRSYATTTYGARPRDRGCDGGAAPKGVALRGIGSAGLVGQLRHIGNKLWRLARAICCSEGGSAEGVARPRRLRR